MEGKRPSNKINICEPPTQHYRYHRCPSHPLLWSLYLSPPSQDSHSPELYVHYSLSVLRDTQYFRHTHRHHLLDVGFQRVGKILLLKIRVAK